MACAERLDRYLGDPPEGAEAQHAVGKYNYRSASERGPDRLIAAVKRGNARVAKGPCCMHAPIERKGVPLDENVRLRKNRETGETLFSEGGAVPKGQTRKLVNAQGESVQESRMRENRTSGSTKGEWVAVQGMRLLRHIREILKPSYAVA